MSDTPKFTVVDRRKFRADAEEAESNSAQPAEPAKPPAPSIPSNSTPASGPAPAPATGPATASASGPRLVERPSQAPAKPEPPAPSFAAGPEPLEDESLPPAPSAEESIQQRQAYDRAAERIEDLVRAQNPGAPPQEKIGFEHLVQQLYVTALMQMGAIAAEGQRPRLEIRGARQTIDLLGILQEKTRGNLSKEEAANLDTILFELRMAFLEISMSISVQPPMPPPPGGAKR